MGQKFANIRACVAGLSRLPSHLVCPLSGPMVGKRKEEGIMNHHGCLSLNRMNQSF
jgi:hypothetical protein